MKLYALLLFHNYNIVKTFYDLSDINFFYRPSATKIIETVVIELIKNKDDNRYYAINEKIKNLEQFEFQIFMFGKNNNEKDKYHYIVISDNDYPHRIGFNLINIIKDLSFDNSQINTLWNDYRNPKNIDKILKIQNEIDETKIIMLQSIEQVMKRGESIEDIIKKTESLVIESKILQEKTEKMNRCCVIL